MSREIIGYSTAEHPGPYRARVGLAALFYGLFAAPIFWVGTLLTSYGLSAHACFPAHDPLQVPVGGFGFVWPLILAMYAVTILLCASAFVVSYRNWRTTGMEAAGHGGDLVEIGEGRTRYLSIIGMCYSVIFSILTIAGLIIFAVVPVCGY